MGADKGRGRDQSAPTESGAKPFMFDVEGISVITTPAAFRYLAPGQVVVLDGDSGPISVEQEEVLADFVRHGGGLVCCGDAAEVYHEYAILGEVLGHINGRCTPKSEIVARIATSNHYITRRVEPSFAVQEAIYLLDIVPADAEIVWRTTWHYVAYTLAYARTYGLGRVFCTTLGSTKSSQSHPMFQQMMARALRYASGIETTEQAARVAMIGYGAIGFEHGTAIRNVPGLEYALVCDRNEARLAVAREAFPGVRTCTDMDEVINDPTIDLVIISTPPNTHAEITMQMLHAGKHVVSEKPFCLTSSEADAMIQLAQERQRALTVYQCRRWDPDYLAIQQII